MQTQIKRISVAVLAVVMVLSMTSCNLLGNGKKTYAAYVQSILDAVYKADFAGYMEITGASEEEAQAVYDDGINYLAEALKSAYGVSDLENEDINTQFKDLAKMIYGHAEYEITDTTKEDGIYKVTISIKPIDILQITYDDVVAYISTMNDKVAAGDYNDYELEDYQAEYARGIIKILKDAEGNIGTLDSQEVTVTIIDDGQYYYISDADFKMIDETILATNVVNEDGTVSQPSGDDATEAASEDSEASEDTEATEASEEASEDTEAAE